MGCDRLGRMRGIEIFEESKKLEKKVLSEIIFEVPTSFRHE
jgi:uncharacterized protein YuzE